MATYWRLIQSPDSPPRREPLKGVCVWCGSPADSEDHYVPKWYARRAKSFWVFNKVPACAPCNVKKGPLPPGLYASLLDLTGKVRRSDPRWRRENREWSDIATYYGTSKVPPELRAFVDAAMREAALPTSTTEGDIEADWIEMQIAFYAKREKIARRRAASFAKDPIDTPATLGDLWPQGDKS